MVFINIICVVGQTPEECYECSGETWESCAGVNHTCRISEKCVSAASAFTQGITIFIYLMCMYVYGCCEDGTEL